MAKRHIFVDNTEIVLIDLSGKKAAVLNLTSDKIIRIQFDSIKEMKLFKKIPSEKISFVIRGREKPLAFTKKKEKEFFDAYKDELTGFIKRHHITFVNNLEKKS